MIKIGTSGFSFATWRGSVYPKHLKSKDMITYYQECLGFDMVELDFTFYTMPSRRSLAGLTEKTHRDFQFVVKANRLMTHDIRDPHTRKIRDNSGLFDQFLFALRPMQDQGKLGCVLFQFPQSFRFSGENMSYLWSCRQRMEEIPIAVEFRTESWNRDVTFRFLRKNNIAYCAADLDPIYGSMPFIDRTTSSETAFFRFHGRDDSWIDRRTGLRHVHLYSDSDLFWFRGKIIQVAEKAKTTYICFNNCHAGASARNAKQMKRLLGISDSGNGISFDLFDSHSIGQ